MHTKHPTALLNWSRSLIKVRKVKTDISEENSDSADRVDKGPMSKSREAILSPKPAFEIGKTHNNIKRHSCNNSISEGVLLIFRHIYKIPVHKRGKPICCFL